VVEDAPWVLDEAFLNKNKCVAASAPSIVTIAQPPFNRFLCNQTTARLAVTR
jgi:hypothetical protein